MFGVQVSTWGVNDPAAAVGDVRSFLAGGGFGAFTTNFEDLGGLRQLPGLAVQRLMAEGYGFGAEGDWKTTTLRDFENEIRWNAAHYRLAAGI